MKAVILAGGEGTRLRPLTALQPKPMLPMANRPMAEHVVKLLARAGIDEIVVTVAFLANTIRTYFGDGSELGVRITYAVEESPLGTAGSVRNAFAHTDETFLVISGDVLTDIDLGSLVAFHEHQSAIATIALHSVDNPLEFGIVITDHEGRIERFLEKPSWGEVFSDTINTGIYVLEPEVLEAIATGRPVDFSSEVFPALLEKGHRLTGFVCDGYWEDVGTIEAYLRAQRDILAGRVDVELDGFPLRPGVHVGTGVEIDPTASLESPVLIGDNCRIGPGSTVGAFSVLGANVRLSDNVVVERSVIHDNVYLGARTVVRNSVIGRSTDCRSGVHLADDVVLGEGCHIGREALLHAGVRVYPNKTVEAGATVTSSIVWESRGLHRLFGPLGVRGVANVDLSPEVALRVAMAFGSMLPKGSVVTTSRDSSRAARVLKRAAMAGLNAVGIDVEDLEVATVPVTRYHVRSSACQGGVTLRLAPDDPEEVILRLLDDRGMDIGEVAQRKVERLYDREESRRVLAGEIGDIDFPSRVLELYTAELVSHVDLTELRQAKWRLVLDYAFGTASFVMPNVLAKLGADVLAVNPHVSTVGVLSYERGRHAQHVADLVRSSGADLGACIDPDGEQLTVIDDDGHVLSDGELLGCLVELVARSVPGASIAVPLDASHTLEQLAAPLGASVIRTRCSTRDLVERAVDAGAVLAGTTAGGYLFPPFLPALDGVATLVHLLSLLSARGARLSHILRGVPGSRVVRLEVPTPFEHKGAVMRGLLERGGGTVVPTLDGVEVADTTGWALAVPDPELPLTRIVAEDSDPLVAEARAAQLGEEIASLVGEAAASLRLKSLRSPA